mmetsp:Transcript_16782/g.29398  ORF Transcript_16782/g.29398 Transcript_16782/m.29398 type:complete len:493 (+) Transcript_16782:133-1611(+)
MTTTPSMDTQPQASEAIIQPEIQSHAQPPAKEPDTVTISIDMGIPCPLCTATFQSESDALHHVNTHLIQDEMEKSEALAKVLASSNSLKAIQGSAATLTALPEQPPATSATQLRRSSIDDSPSHHGMTDEQFARHVQLSDMDQAGNEEQVLDGQTLIVPKGMIRDTAENMHANLMDAVSQVQMIEYGSETLRIRGSIKSFHTCSEFDFFPSSIFGFGWNCSYVNLQNIWSCLLRHPYVENFLSTKHDLKDVPTILQIQYLLQEAWKAGYDKESGQEIGNLIGEQKWIGAVDCAALLRFLGIRACIVDFELKDDPAAKKKFLEWIYQYFEKRCAMPPTSYANGSSQVSGLTSLIHKIPVVGARHSCMICQKMNDRYVAHGVSNGAKIPKKPPVVIPPLFLQHSGHSRSIIGAEKYKNGEIKLLVLDTNRACIEGMRGEAGLSRLRKDLSSEELSEARYQIMFVSHDMFYRTPQEMDESRNVISEFATDHPRSY